MEYGTVSLNHITKMQPADILTKAALPKVRHRELQDKLCLVDSHSELKECRDRVQTMLLCCSFVVIVLVEIKLVQDSSTKSRFS